MKRNLLSATLLCCSAVLVGTAAFGQSDNPCGQEWTTPLKEITGTITKVYDSYIPGTRKQGRHLDVAVDDSQAIVTVHVFPIPCINNNPDPFTFEEGEQVTARGSEFRTQQGGRHLNICAQSIPSHDLPDLRDEQDGRLNTDYCRPANTGVNCDQMCQGAWNYKMCMKGCRNGTSMGGPGQRGFPGPR